MAHRVLNRFHRQRPLNRSVGLALLFPPSLQDLCELYERRSGITSPAASRRLASATTMSERLGFPGMPVGIRLSGSDVIRLGVLMWDQHFDAIDTIHVNCRKSYATAMLAPRKEPSSSEG